jgi:hypothetical protein
MQVCKGHVYAEWRLKHSSSTELQTGSGGKTFEIISGNSTQSELAILKIMHQNRLPFLFMHLLYFYISQTNNVYLSKNCQTQNIMVSSNLLLEKGRGGG